MSEIQTTNSTKVFDPIKYQKVFSENYRGVSEQGKELETFLKHRESGRSDKVSYIPWAVLIRMSTQQDPTSELEKVRAEDGTFLFYNGRKLADGKDDACYFVKVKATFLGKVITEEYPVQDFDFEPVSFTGRTRTLSSGKTREIKIDSNIINKALQRASAKVLSIITGLGLSLYETGDLQFEEESKVPATANVDKKTGEIVVPAQVDASLMIDADQLKAIEELAKDEKVKARLDKALASYKAPSYKDFTKAQASTVIKALGKPIVPPVVKATEEVEKKQ